MLDKELYRLLKREDFVVEVCDFESNSVFTKTNFQSAGEIRNAAKKYSGREWAGFQLYYPMAETELLTCSGFELVQAICGVFDEVIATMNYCMQVPLKPA